MLTIDQRFLTPEVTRKITHLSEKSIQELIQQGKFPASVEIDGNTGFTIDKRYYKRDVGMGEGEMELCTIKSHIKSHPQMKITKAAYSYCLQQRVVTNSHVRHAAAFPKLLLHRGSRGGCGDVGVGEGS